MNQPLEVNDFSGGMTDNYIDGQPNQGQNFDNLLIDTNKKPFTRPGSVIRDVTAYQIPSGNKRISYMAIHRNQLLEQSERNIYWEASSVYNTLVGPTGNPAFSAGAVTDNMSSAFWNNHTLFVSDNFCNPIKVFRATNSTGPLTLIQAGLPVLASMPALASAGGSGSNYIYAFHYFYTYNAEGVTFNMSGTTVTAQILNVAAPDQDTITITGIPVLANSTTGNYDTANIFVKIFRTQANGTTLNYIGQVTNGTTTYIDTAADSAIVNAAPIYTTGNILDNDAPPPAKFVCQSNDTTFYGYVMEGGVAQPNRIRQSNKGTMDSCPTSFTDDFPEEIVGLNSIQSTLIVFCTDSVYRVDGIFDQQGNGGMAHLKINDTFGAVSNDAIVQVDNGIVFASRQGWCYCDGYNVTRIALHLDTTYPQLVANSAREMWGAYDRNNQRVWFAAQKNSASLDNDTCYVLDLKWGLNERSTFTSASNNQGTNWRPTCLLFDSANMYRAHNTGFVFLHNSTYTTDPLIDLSKTASQWATSTIMHDYKSCAFNFGTSFVRKFVSKITTVFSNITNIAIQIISNSDDGRVVQPLTEIRAYSSIIWGDPEKIWGDPTMQWNVSGLIDSMRRFPAGGLRCNYKQIEITNSFTIIGNSDLYSTGTVDPVAKTLTFTNANSVWPTDVVGYFIFLANDTYTNMFQVVARNSDTQVLLLDPLSQLPTAGAYQWLMKGYRKGEIMRLLNYVIHYKMLSTTQRAYHATTDSGGN